MTDLILYYAYYIFNFVMGILSDNTWVGLV